MSIYPLRKKTVSELNQGIERRDVEAGNERDKKQFEGLSEYAHSAWSGWMKYLFEKSIPYKPGKIQAEDGAVIIPKWAVDRWTRQMNIEYKNLPEIEKETDREEAKKMLKIINNESK